MKVTVLGAGFDALLAVHAASLLSHDVTIIAETAEAEHLIGPQLLRAPIPMIEVPMASLKVDFKGDADTMMDKLLNQGGAGHEPETAQTGILTWEAFPTYRWLWETYGRFVKVRKKGIGFGDVAKIKQEEEADWLISTIDRDDLCGDRNHSFAAAPIVYMPAPGGNIPQSWNGITYSGDSDDAWFVESVLWGESWRGYGSHRHPPVSPEKLSADLLPQGYQCDCHTDVISAYVGKLGIWSPTWQRHWSFYQTFSDLDGR